MQCLFNDFINLDTRRPQLDAATAALYRCPDVPVVVQQHYPPKTPRHPTIVLRAPILHPPHTGGDVGLGNVINGYCLAYYNTSESSPGWHYTARNLLYPPKKNPIVIKPESRDRYIMENKLKSLFLTLNQRRSHRNCLSFPPCDGGQYSQTYQANHTFKLSSRSA